VLKSILIPLTRYLLRSNDSYGWHLQYLTIIGLSLATATVSVGLIADLTGNRTLFAAKNALSVASAPMACLVSVLYWGLRAVRRSRRFLYQITCLCHRTPRLNN